MTAIRLLSWATDRDVKEPTITYNLGAKYMVGSVILYWENNNAEKWHVETSMDGQTWKTQKTCEGKLPMAKGPIQTINLDKPVEARYVRIRIEKYSGSWNNVALYEFEVYQEESEVVVTPFTVADELVKSVAVKDGKVTISNKIPEKYTFTWGCNYEQVVGADGTIYTPLVDTDVEITVTVREKDNTNVSGSVKTTLTIPGKHSASEGNAKPAVAPELAQWYSSAEQKDKVFTLTAGSRIVTDETMRSVAEELKKDIQDRFGLDLPIVTEAAKAGDIQLKAIEGAGFDNETYNMVVTDRVEIQANHTTGAYWGTRSVLQALVLSGNQTIAQGTARDYPEFKTRGFMLDVGRKPMSMEMLREFVKNMAWYKMNDFHIHLSDNLIFMEDYVDAGKTDEAWGSYQGFRLESDKEGLASKDYHYTKEEFKSFIKDSRALGVNITPEIDVPAHALSVANYIKNTLKRPDLVLHKLGNHGKKKRPWFDHVDISKPEAIDIVKTIFDEYIDEDVFDENTVVHIGADEFYDSHPAYRNFLIQMIDYIKNVKHRQVRVWGSLSQMSGQNNVHPFTSEDVQGAQMNIWNTGWANPQAMFDLGFNLINTVDGPLYMVPSGKGNRGGYGDFLQPQSLYNGWEPENIGDTWIPTGSSQMMGASFAIWQDNIDTHAAGINETDTFYRFMDALPYLGVKMWGIGGDGLDRNFEQAQANIRTLGIAPNSNPYHEIDLAADAKAYAQYDFANDKDISGNNRNLTLNNAEIKDGALILKGGASNAATGLNVMGPNNAITMRVYKDGASKNGEQILFESDAAYGENTIKAIPSNNGKWKLGFARELYEYVFNYELPHDQWVELTIRNEGNKTYLLVDGKKIEAVGSFLPDEHATTQFMGKTGIEHSSFDMPVARIGSKTNAFQGKIDSVAFHAKDVTPSIPSEKPTETPTEKPTEKPTEQPTDKPTDKPEEKAGWVKVDGGWKYRNEDGSFHIGWLQLNDIWYYCDADGMMLTGWQYLNNNWFYMNENGVMLTGWQYLNNNWFYMDENGYMLTGWQYLGGNWFYMNESGYMLTGWQYLDGNWFYMNESGYMLTGWQYLGDNWFYMNESGYMLTGWQYLGDNWFYMDENGYMQTGWQWIGGNCYYFYSSGAMAANTTINGSYVNGSGAWVA